jgi:hypothetical protein
MFICTQITHITHYKGIMEWWTKLTSTDKTLPITINIFSYRYAFPWSICMCIMLLQFLRFNVPTTSTMKVVPWGSHKSDYESCTLRLNMTVTSPDWPLPHVCTTSFHAWLTILFWRQSSKFFWNAGTYNRLQDVTSQNTTIWVFIAVRTPTSYSFQYFVYLMKHWKTVLMTILKCHITNFGARDLCCQ